MSAVPRSVRSYALLLPLLTNRRGMRGLLLAGLALAMLWLGAYWSRQQGATSSEFLSVLTLLLYGGGLVGLNLGILHSAIRQNHPALSNLVPRLRRRLALACAALHLACCLALAAVLSLWLGHFGYLLAGASVMFSILMLSFRFAVLGLLPSALIFLVLGLYDAIGAQVLALLFGSAELQLTLLALGLAAVLQAWGLGHILPRGGDRHWDWMQRLARNGARLRDGGSNQRGGWLSGWRRGYFASLRRDSLKPAPASRMMLHTLGITGHEGGYIVLGLAFAALAALAVVTGGAGIRLFKEPPGIHLMQLFSLLTPLMYVASVLAALPARRREQALYLLTPGAPLPAAVNRLLATELLRRFGLVWLAAVVAAGAVDSLMVGAARLDPFTILMAALMLSFSTLLLRDYAAMRSATNYWRLALFTMMATVLGLAALSLTAVRPALPWWQLSLSITLLGMMVLAWRWRAMMAAPVALPAARMAP